MEQTMVSQDLSLEELTEIRVGWLEMGRQYTKNLIRIAKEMGHPVSRDGQDCQVFATDNVTLIYYYRTPFIPQGFSYVMKKIETVFVTTGAIVDLEKKCGYRGRDTQLQMREFKVCALSLADFDLAEAGIPNPYEVFVPAFRGWLDEILAYLPEANHRMELRELARLNAQKKEIRNELLMNDHPVSIWG